MISAKKAKICFSIQIIFLSLTLIGANQMYLNEWTMLIPKGLEAAQDFAQEHGFELLNEVIPDSNYFHMRYPKLRSKRSIEPAHHVTKKILDSNWEVFEAEQQIAKTRVKRDDIMQGTNCNGGNTCCTPTNQCPENQGDCDSDNDCKGNLKCGNNNCPKETGHSTRDDCCYNPESIGVEFTTNGHMCTKNSCGKHGLNYNWCTPISGKYAWHPSWDYCNPKPVNCQLSDWGPCICNEAIKTRNVTIPAKNGGNCSQLIESCDLRPCHVCCYRRKFCNCECRSESDWKLNANAFKDCQPCPDTPPDPPCRVKNN